MTPRSGIPARAGMATAAYKLPTRGNVINLRPADSYPFHSSASGIAYLAFCSPQKRDQLLELPRKKLTRFTITDQADLLALCDMTKTQGFACARNTVEEGVSSIAMPFFTDGSDPAGTISIAVPDLNLTEEHQAMLMQKLRVAIRQLEVALTGRNES